MVNEAPLNASACARIQPFFDPSTSTFSYVVYADSARECAIIDSVLGFDLRSGAVSTAQVESIAGFVESRGLTVQWLLETHVHADHISGAAWLRERVGGRIGISEKIVDVQKLFKHEFNLGDEFEADGSEFDYLFRAGEAFSIGMLDAEAMYVPGHTPADLAYRIGNEALFVGDTLFMPDVGTARCDFPGGDVHRLYESIQRILSLAPEMQLYLCHDYPPGGREPTYRSQVATQRAVNIHVQAGITERDFTKMRTARDAGLALPQLFFPAIQANIRAGKLPPPERGGKRYFKLPVTEA